MALAKGSERPTKIDTRRIAYSVRRDDDARRQTVVVVVVAVVLNVAPSQDAYKRISHTLRLVGKRKFWENACAALQTLELK